MTVMKIEKMKISIIIPIYNAEAYIEECIRSVERQSLHELEIICIDDGSKDTSSVILNRLSKEFPNIKLLKQENQGAGNARNLGIQHASGKYIAFLDADDFYCDELSLEKIVSFMDENSLKICGSYRKNLINGSFEECPFLKEYRMQSKGTIIRYKDFQYDFDYQSFVYRRSFLTEEKLWFPEYRRYQDPPFFVRAMIAAKEFGIVPMVLYCYRLGHQNPKVLYDGIEDLLRGVRDVLGLAIEHHLKKLYELTLFRINVTFYEAIIQNLTINSVRLLTEIAKTNQEYGYGIPVRAMEEICQVNQVKRILDGLNDSYGLLQKISCLQYQPMEFQKFFQVRNISSVVIHGAGVFGAYLVRLLSVTKVKIVGIIDKSAKSSAEEFEQFHILGLDEAVPECDAIIVSLLNPDALMEEYQGNGMEHVYAFRNIVEQIVD